MTELFGKSKFKKKLPPGVPESDRESFEARVEDLLKRWPKEVAWDIAEGYRDEEGNWI